MNILRIISSLFSRRVNVQEREVVVARVHEKKFVMRMTQWPYVHVWPTRLYMYQINEARPNDFMDKYHNDMIGNNVTRNELDRALMAYDQPITAGTVIIHTGDWTGQFEIAANGNNKSVLILCLTENADDRDNIGLDEMA
jgi:hypothetical protein